MRNLTISSPKLMDFMLKIKLHIKKNRRITLWFYLLLLSLQVSAAYPALLETLPTYHRAYDYLEALQARGYCLDLLIGNVPYTRGEIAESLLKIAKNPHNKMNSRFIKELLRELSAEFRNEILELNSGKPVGEQLKYQTHFVLNLESGDSKKPDYKGTYRTGVGVRVGDQVYGFSGVNFDQYDYEDPFYTGYKWRGFAGYTEQAYISFQWKRIDLKFGRDFIKWGFGKTGTLLMSNNARPIDNFLGSVDFGPFKFTFFGGQLSEFPARYIDEVRMPAKRYLSGHRLDLSLFNGRLQAAISEMMLYGGYNETFNLTYLNPLIFYHGAHKNQSSYLGNELPTIEIMVYPKTNWQIYTSWLIDDYQIERVEINDLEPNEIGWLAGTQWADALNFPGLSLSTEYVRISNRTYKAPEAMEKFIHFGKLLGHPLGNDFDKIDFEAMQWLSARAFLKLGFSYTRHGEGSVYTPWDTPWQNSTLEKGYTEPFPTGLVEKIARTSLVCAWCFRKWLWINSELEYITVENEENILDNNRAYFEGKFSIELALHKKWNFTSMK